MENKPKKLYMPTNDYIFKRIFGSEKNSDILQDLLSSILPELNIKSVKVNQEVSLEKQGILGKLSRLDIIARLQDGTIINIEMQNIAKEMVIDRSLYYSSALINQSLGKKEIYKDIPRVISIWILGQDIFDEGPYHEIARLRRDYQNRILTDKTGYHFIQLEKFKNTHKRLGTKIEEWLEFFIKTNLEELKMSNNEFIRKAEEEWELLNDDDLEREYAERVEMSRIFDEIEKNQKYEEGSKNEKKEIAKKMLKENLEDSLILKLTELTKEELNEIKNNLDK